MIHAAPPPSQRPLDVPSRCSIPQLLGRAASEQGSALPALPPLQAASLLPPGQRGKLRRKAGFPATLQVEIKRQPLLSAQAWPAAFSGSLPYVCQSSKFEAMRISRRKAGGPCWGGEEERRREKGGGRAQKSWVDRLLSGRREGTWREDWRP